MSTGWQLPASAEPGNVNLAQINGVAVPGASGYMPIDLRNVSGQSMGLAALNADDNPAGYSVLASAAPRLYNDAGNVFERQRNNTQGTLLASAARTTSGVTSPVQTNYNARGVVLFLNVTAASGTGGLGPRIQAVDPVSGATSLYAFSPTNIVTTGLFLFPLYPAAAATNVGSGVNQVSTLPLPRNWQAIVYTGDATAYTYSLGYAYIV